jgi:GNAT superfamily N-acetyltransferase
MTMNAILDDFSPSVLIRAIEANAIEGCKAWQGWPGLELHEEPDMNWTLTKIPFALFNNVFRVRVAPDNIQASIEAVLARVKGRNVPMLWWVGPSTQPADLATHLVARGLLFAGSSVGMAVDLLALNPSLSTPPGLSIEEVDSTETFGAWCRVMTSVYEFPDFAARAWFDMHFSLGLGRQQPWRHFLARLDGKPVATASLFLGAGVAGIANVATLPEARQQGIGAAITLAPLREARRLGYRIGTLFATETAKEMYRNLGFREYCQGQVYIWVTD